MILSCHFVVWRMHNRSYEAKRSLETRIRTTVLALLAGTALLSAGLTPANAFTLFGHKFFESEDPAQDVLDPVRYTVALNVEAGDGDLKEKIESASQLLADKDDPVSGDLGVAIKARDDRDRLLATLYENARYGAVVTVTVNGIELSELPPNPAFDRTAPVPVAVTIRPGPRFTLGEVDLRGDAARFSPDALGLGAGADAGSLAIIKAGEKVVAELKNEGRPLAKLTARDVVADHKTNRVDVTLAAEGGPVAPIGETSVSGSETVDSEFVRDYSLLNGGRPYSPAALNKASERLRKLGVFSSVTIREAQALDDDGRIPVDIKVSEGKHRYFGIGAQYSTIDGFGVQGYWGHRNLFGRAESLRVEGAVSRLGETLDVQQLDYSAGILFSKPGFILPTMTLNASLKAKIEVPDAYEAKTVTAAAGLAYELNDTDKISGGGEISYAKTEDAFGVKDYLTFSIPVEFERDVRDDKLDPTSGYRAMVNAKPSYEALQGTIFSSFEASASGYYAFGAEDDVVLAGKLSAGTIIGGGSLENIPVNRRFYAGGGGSVRGYSYQQISPRNSQGEATGGRSYVQTSLEARVKVTETIGIVPFVDAATVSDEAVPDFSDIRAGAGLGLRYATPFGPIRLDVAVPLQSYEGGSRYGIYAGIGQAF